MSEQGTTTVVEQSAGKFSAVSGRCAICGKVIALGVAGESGATCKRHVGKVGLYYKPAPEDVSVSKKYIRIKILCDESVKLGMSRGFAVSLTGGDAGTKPPKSADFQVYIVGSGNSIKKYVPVKSLKALAELLKK